MLHSEDHRIALFNGKLRRSWVRAFALLPFVVLLEWGLICNAFSAYGLATFDNPGLGWVCMNAMINGALGGATVLLIGLPLTQPFSFNCRLFLSLACAVVLICFGIILDTGTRLDTLILKIGYQLTIPYLKKPLDASYPTSFQSVLPANSQVCATTPIGKICIVTGRGLLRTYEWHGASRSVQLTLARDDRDLVSRRSLNGWPGYDFVEHDGVSRLNALETRLYFSGEGQALAYLRAMNSSILPLVHTRDGLTIGWSKGTDRSTLTVFIAQVLINGIKPENLPQSNDSAISISPSKEP